MASVNFTKTYTLSLAHTEQETAWNGVSQIGPNSPVSKITSISSPKIVLILARKPSNAIVPWAPSVRIWCVICVCVGVFMQILRICMVVHLYDSCFIYIYIFMCTIYYVVMRFLDWIWKWVYDGWYIGSMYLFYVFFVFGFVCFIFRPIGFSCNRRSICDCL